MTLQLLQRKHVELVDAVVVRICGRSTSVFRRSGDATCRRHADAGLAALEQDLANGKSDAAREFAYAMIEELGADSLTFADVRLFVVSLRSEVRGALAGEGSAELRADVEQWFFELLLVASMRFIAWRDELSRRNSAKQAVARLESQLVELEQALDEKTQLLELIRQASTPIVPVVRGVLVVPLVGTFDGFRAGLLNERLLHEVVRLAARTAILDISGVPVFDSYSAQLISSLARSVRLLGARVFLVGVSPTIARTIVGLGIELDSVETFASLQDGLARALALQNMLITARKSV